MIKKICWLGLLLVGVAQAEVTEVSQNGFSSEHKLVLAANSERAFEALTKDVALWWDASHSYGGKAAAFSMQLREGGCFCERLSDGGFVEHMRVVHVQAGRQLTLSGGLGPLQSMGVAGSMIFIFTPHDKGTSLTYRYTVGGFNPGGLESMADAVDRVQLGQLLRLQQFLATGVALN